MMIVLNCLFHLSQFNEFEPFTWCYKANKQWMQDTQCHIWYMIALIAKCPMILTLFPSNWMTRNYKETHFVHISSLSSTLKLSAGSKLKDVFLSFNYLLNQVMNRVWWFAQVYIFIPELQHIMTNAQCQMGWNLINGP